VVLGEQVRDGVESSNNTANHANHDLLVGDLALTKISQVLRDIMSHLRGRGGSTILVLNHAVMELRGHGNDHVVIVRVEVTALGDVQTEGSVVVVTSKQVVGIVNQTWLVSVGLGELRRPHTIVGILGLMNGEIGWPDSVMNHTLSEVPLLEVVTSVLLVSRVDLGGEDHAVHQFSLLETLVDQEIVLLMHGTVATLARSLEDLKTTSQTKHNISDGNYLSCALGLRFEVNKIT
jgi:hypothetical protein